MDVSEEKWHRYGPGCIHISSQFPNANHTFTCEIQEEISDLPQTSFFFCFVLLFWLLFVYEPPCPPPPPPPQAEAEAVRQGRQTLTCKQRRTKHPICAISRKGAALIGFHAGQTFKHPENRWKANTADSCRLQKAVRWQRDYLDRRDAALHSTQEKGPKELSLVPFMFVFCREVSAFTSLFLCREK